MINFRKKKLIFGILVIFLCLTFSFKQVAFASGLGRSAAGGGEMAEFNFGQWAAAQGIGIASFFIGSAIGSAIETGSFAQGFSNTFAMGNEALSAGTGFYGTFTTFAVAQNIGLATGQLGSALSNSGMDPRAAIFLSSVLGGAISGGLNPGGVLGIGFNSAVDAGVYTAQGVLSGMALGAVQGAVSGGILAALADDKGQTPFWAGPVASLAGGFATNLLVGGFSPTVTAGNGETAIATASFSFGNNFSFDNALSYSMKNLVNSIPLTALHIGINAFTQDMKPGDRMIWQAAFSGLDPIVGALTNVGISGMGMGSFFPLLESRMNQDDLLRTLDKYEEGGGVGFPRGTIMDSWDKR